MVRGIGLDLTPIDRIAKILERHPGRFEAKVYTDGERAYCRGRAQAAQHFAARFAAKEAALKALGVPEGLRWHELEVVSRGDGAPSLVLHGEAARAAARMGVQRVLLSITHAGGLAAAVVVLDGEMPQLSRSDGEEPTDGDVRSDGKEDRSR